MALVDSVQCQQWPIVDFAKSLIANLTPSAKTLQNRVKRNVKYEFPHFRRMVAGI